jgi:predicted nucleic acid-binding protein
MARVVVLDSGPLGLVTNPRGSAVSIECNDWLRELLAKGTRVFVPEIADYEVRRELLRADKQAGIKRLDVLKTILEYLPITTDAMLLAAESWAVARQQGRPTAPDRALDGDVILAAQTRLLGVTATDPVVATVNVGHVARFVPADTWSRISAD